MKFHGLVSEIMIGVFLPEKGRLQLHFWYNSLNFEARLVFLHLMRLWNKLYELFLEDTLL